MQTIYENGNFDFHFVCNDERKIPAHKFILVNFSKFFSRMFSGKFKDDKELTVEFKYDDMKSVVKYIYGWDLPNLSKEILHILAYYEVKLSPGLFADMRLDDLINLSNDLVQNNEVDYFQDMIVEVLVKCVKLKVNISHASHASYLLKLPSSVIKAFLSSDLLNTEHETNVLSFIIAYYRANLYSRAEVKVALLSCVRDEFVMHTSDMTGLSRVRQGVCNAFLDIFGVAYDKKSLKERANPRISYLFNCRFVWSKSDHSNDFPVTMASYLKSKTCDVNRIYVKIGKTTTSMVEYLESRKIGIDDLI